VAEFWKNDAPVTPPQASPAPPAANWWQGDSLVQQAEPSVAGDIAKGAGRGLVQGTLSMLGGAPGDIVQLAKGAAEKVLPEPAPDDGAVHLNWLDRTFPNAMKRIREEHERFQKLPSAQVGHGDVPGTYEPPTTAQMMEGLEKVTGQIPKPEGAAGKYAESISSFVPAAVALGPAEGVAGAVSNIGKLAALPGAASEFLGNKVEGTWLEPYARLFGALGGAGLGGAASKATEALANRSAATRAATAAGGDISPSAVARVAKNYEADALTPAAVAARQAELGPEAMFMDMGRQLGGRAEAIASQPGKGQNAVLDAVEGRTGTFGSETAARTKGTLDQVMGPSPDIVATKNHINDVVDRMAKPLYDQVMSANPVVNVPASITSRPVVAQAMKDAGQLAKNHGENITGTKELKTELAGPGYHIAEEVNTPAKTSLAYWDYVKKALDSRINGMMKSGGIQDLDSAGKADLAGMMTAKKALVDHLDDVTGGAYAMARKASATKFQVNDAIDFGRSALNTKLLPEELGEHLTGMSLPEREGVKAGMRREIDRIIDTARNDGAAARRILDTNQNREKIAHVFGQDAADAIDKRIAAETHFQTTTNNIAGNSRTSVRQELRKDTEAPSNAQAPSTTMLGVGHAALRRGQQYLGDLALERTKEGIANLLTRQGNDIPTLAQVLSDYNAARVRNAPAPFRQQASGLAGVLATQAPGWLLGGPRYQSQAPQ
jgi:hypothetical protein